MKIKSVFSTVGLLSLCLSGIGQAAPAPGYHLIKRVPLAGDTGWDYLTCDAAARRIYISRGTHVMVLNADDFKVVGDIPNTDGVHGIALAPELNRGFISDGKADTVTIFDLRTLKTLGTAPTGNNPDGIAYDSATRRVFACNGRSNNATVINAATGKVDGTIALSGKPEFPAADGRGHVFINIESTSEVDVIDSRKLTVDARWPVAPGESPSGLAIDRIHHRLFVGCDGQKMIVLSSDNGSLKAAPAIDDGVDATAFDAGTGLAFSSNGSGTLTVVHEDSSESFPVVQVVATQKGARTMALDTKTHQVTLITAQFVPAPPPAPGQKHLRPKLIPGSVVLLVYGLGGN